MDPLLDAPQVVLPAAAPGAVRDLPPAGLDPAAVAAAPVRPRDGAGGTVAEVLVRHGARRLVVLHRGRLAYEWAAPGADPEARWVCFSVTKSMTGTLAALAVHEGALDRSAVVGDLVPALAGSGFGTATVGEVADMTASVDYTEDYTEAAAGASAGGTPGFGDYMAALFPDAQGGLRGLAVRLGPGPDAHGGLFVYATPKTDVLGWVLEAARGAPYADLLRTTVWDHVGAEHDGVLALDATGTAVLGAGLAVTTRDLARLGLALAEGRVVPRAVLDAMRTGGDTAAFQRGGRYAYLDGYSYRDQWWLPGGPTQPLSGWGIFGQLLWVDVEAEVVIALHSADTVASDQARDLAHDALARTLTDLVR